MEKDLSKQIKMIELGTEDILIREELKKIVEYSILKDKPLKVKLGLDPLGRERLRSKAGVGDAPSSNPLQDFGIIG